MKKLKSFFYLILIFICFGCSTTKKLSERTTKTDVIKNFESYIKAYNWLYFNGYINQKSSTYNIDKDFMKMKIKIEKIDSDIWNIKWNDLLTDSSFIMLSNIGEQLIKYKNNRMVYQFGESLSNSSNIIKGK